MKAMILCAGLGTRLRPLTEIWPKPAMPFLGQPLFDYALAVLKTAQVTQVGINTHYLPDKMREVARDSCKRFGLGLTEVHEPIIQGTGGGIRGLKSFFSDGNFIVFNGDILFPIDLSVALQAHADSKAAATMVLLPMPLHEQYASVEIDDAHRVRRIAGRGPGASRFTPWHFSGVHILSPRVFDYMKSEGAEDINKDVYLRMLDSNECIQGFIIPSADTAWSDMGTLQRYLFTHHAVLQRRMSLQTLKGHSPFASLVAQGSENFLAHRNAHFSHVRVAGPAVVCEGAHVGEDVWLGSSVSIGRNATVGKGAHLNRVAVLDGASVPEHAHLEDCIVAPDSAPLGVKG